MLFFSRDVRDSTTVSGFEWKPRDQEARGGRVGEPTLASPHTSIHWLPTLSSAPRRGGPMARMPSRVLSTKVWCSNTCSTLSGAIIAKSAAYRSNAMVVSVPTHDMGVAGGLGFRGWRHGSIAARCLSPPGRPPAVDPRSASLRRRAHAWNPEMERGTVTSARHGTARHVGAVVRSFVVLAKKRDGAMAFDVARSTVGGAAVRTALVANRMKRNDACSTAQSSDTVF